MKFSKYNIITKKKDDDSYYLFNTNTGATFQIDENIKKEIDQANINSFTKEKQDEYIKTGIMIEDNIDEDRVYSYFYNKQRFNNQVLSLTVLLTYDCNLRCVYCYEGAGEKNKGSMTDETRDSLYNFIVKQVDERDSKIVSMVLFGGEPLLNFKANIEWLDKIKKFCEDNNKTFVTSIITNGILIDEYIMGKLKEYNCQMIQITLDGIKEIHDTRRIYKNKKGSFEEVMRGIKLIHDYPDLHNPVIRINIDKTNISNVKTLIQNLADEGLEDCFIDFGIVKGTTVACSSYTGNCFVDEELGDILEGLWDYLKELKFNFSTTPSRKYLFCGLYNDAAFTISPFGEVYKCWDHVGCEEHMMGKIDNEGALYDVRFPYFDWMTHNPLEVKECRDCAYLPACGGGCGAISFSQSNTYHAKGCFKTIGVLEKQVERYFINNEIKETLESKAN